MVGYQSDDIRRRYDGHSKRRSQLSVRSNSQVFFAQSIIHISAFPSYAQAHPILRNMSGDEAQPRASLTLIKHGGLANRRVILGSSFEVTRSRTFRMVAFLHLRSYQSPWSCILTDAMGLHQPGFFPLVSVPGNRKGFSDTSREWGLLIKRKFNQGKEGPKVNCIIHKCRDNQYHLQTSLVGGSIGLRIELFTFFIT